jgi:hypothetical protein
MLLSRQTVAQAKTWNALGPWKPNYFITEVSRSYRFYKFFVNRIRILENGSSGQGHEECFLPRNDTVLEPPAIQESPVIE